MWEPYDVPRSEGTRIHRIGDALVCIAVEMTGAGDLLAAMPVYPEAGTQKKSLRKKADHAIALPPLEDGAWSRFFIGKAESYELSPGYPPLPACVSLKETFSLPPGATLDGWIFSRVEARVLVAGNELASFPLVKPYKTLYGTPDAGVVCRHDEAQFLASNEPMFDSLVTDPGLVAHPVRLKNASSEPVRVTELCIYGEQLSIFGVGTNMQSERLLFIFSSSGVRMSLDGQGPLPSGATVLAKPKVSGEERFIVRSFELFKAITRL